MTNQNPTIEAANQQAFAEGRLAGLAIGALATSAVAFISLLGLEKALLALALSYFVMRDAKKDSPQRKPAKIALVVALVYVTCYVTMIVLFHDKIAELIRMLQKLG